MKHCETCHGDSSTGAPKLTGGAFSGITMVSALWHGVEPDPPLYYVLQNVAVRIWGVSPLGLRALSILIFVGIAVYLGLPVVGSGGPAGSSAGRRSSRPWSSSSCWLALRSSLAEI